MKVNWNQQAVFTLNERGVKKFNDYWELSQNSQLDPHWPQDVKLSLWEAAKIFGADLYNGSNKIPFVSMRFELLWDNFAGLKKQNEDGSNG